MKISKTYKTLIVAAALLCLISTLFACTAADLDNEGGAQLGTDVEVKITFMDGDTLLKETIVPEEVLEYLPTKDAYELEGWYIDAELTNRLEETPTASITLYAKWKIKTYIVRFINYDGTAIKVNGQDYQTIEHGQAASSPENEPVREGYVFKGWDKDFSVITSNTQVRPKFEKPAYSIILYGQDGETIVKQEEVQAGKDITDILGAFNYFAEESVTGGFLFDGLYSDKELTQAFNSPEKMPEHDLIIYVKVALQGIQALNVSSDRDGDTFRYDRGGVTLTGDFTKSNIVGLNYTYQWKCNGVAVENAQNIVLTVDVLTPGEYVYALTVVATYGDLEPQTSTVDINVSVYPGLLQNLPEEEQLAVSWPSNVLYNGQVVTPEFTNLLPGDKVSYKRSSDNDYKATSPVKNYDRTGYKVDVKIEREYYEPIEFIGAAVMVQKATLKARFYLGNASNDIAGSSYSVEYGSALPSPTYQIEGFVGNDTASTVLKWGSGTTVGSVIYDTNYAQFSPVLASGTYTFGIASRTWKTLDNYNFDDKSWETININVTKKSLVVTVQPYGITYGDVRPQDSEFSVVIGNADETGLPLDRDAEVIPNIIAKSYVCNYVQYANVGNYPITIDFENENLVDAEKEIINSYAITLTTANLIVNPKAVKLTPNPVNVTYGDGIPTYTFKVEGLLSDANVTHQLSDLGNIEATCAYAFKSAVGTYTIYVNEQTITNKNYAVSCGTATLSVAKKAATLTLTESVFIKYGEAFPQDAFNALLKADGLVEGDTVETLKTANAEFTSQYAVGQPVGEYVITINGYVSENYNITYVTKDAPLVVDKANLTIGVKDAKIVYGDKFECEITYFGLGTSDERENPSLAFSKMGGLTAYDGNVGVTTIIAGGYEAINYNISYTEGRLEIVKRTVNVIMDSKSITYGDATPEYTYTLTAYQEGKAIFADGEDLSTLGTLTIQASLYQGNAG
ncbi:MAG: InlB B-repeat-containing protein, partial [Clostridia bacterium]|nr:InlB B-repeat-containing protein [Clostridia bacterium]